MFLVLLHNNPVEKKAIPQDLMRPPFPNYLNGQKGGELLKIAALLYTPAYSTITKQSQICTQITSAAGAFFLACACWRAN
jgi:hypothetical protein